MKPLIMKAAEFDEVNARAYLREPAFADTDPEELVNGALRENARLRPLIEALADVAEAAQFYADQKHVRVKGEQDEGLVRTTRVEGAVEIGWRARKALAALEKELEK